MPPYQLLPLCSKIYTHYGLNSPLPLTELCSGLHFALGFLDSCELVTDSTDGLAEQHPLLTTDVSRVNPQIITIHLRQSKTDQFSKGAHIYLGMTYSILCPVAALLAYLAIRPPTVGPLFIFQEGGSLTRRKLVDHLRAAVSQLGLNTTGYSGHSFRIGAASAAARAGISDSTIQLLGRWKSSAFLAYLRSSKSQLAAASHSMTTTPMDNYINHP